MPRVIYSHPARQQNVPERPAWANKMGLEVTFLTGLYYRQTAFPYVVVKGFPKRMRTRTFRLLRKRRIDDLPDDRVVSVSGVWPEILCRNRGWVHTWNWIHDWYAARWIRSTARKENLKSVIFHGFQGSCRLSMREAKRAGMINILEITQPLLAAKIVAAERKALGLPSAEPIPDSVDVAEIAQANCILVQSRWSASGLELYRKEVPKVLLPLGVDIKLFHPSETETSGFRVLFVGQLCVRKGVHHLIEAWQRLALPGGELLLLGMPSDELGRRIAEEQRPQQRWLKHQSQEQLAKLFRECHAFAGPSLCEAGFNSVYEAAASGLPCIVTDRAGSLIRDGLEGFVVPAGEAGELAAKIKILYDDRALRSKMGRAARRRAEDYSWFHFGERLVKAYRYVIHLADNPSITSGQLYEV